MVGRSGEEGRAPPLRDPSPEVPLPQAGGEGHAGTADRWSKMVSPERIELSTDGLKVHCSTTELRAHTDYSQLHRRAEDEMGVAVGPRMREPLTSSPAIGVWPGRVHERHGGKRRGGSGSRADGSASKWAQVPLRRGA